MPSPQSKAEGVAFALRNAADYFEAKDRRNVSQRILNLYYGKSSPSRSRKCSRRRMAREFSDEIEDSTKVGHGLYTVDGAADGLEHIVVGLFAGFFPTWVAFIGSPVADIPGKKPRVMAYLAACSPASWLDQSRSATPASIPEVADLYADIFEGKPNWVRPSYDQMANAGISLFGGRKPATCSYIVLHDGTGRLAKEDIALFPGPISEITEIEPKGAGRRYRAAIDHPGKQFWWEARRLHHSPSSARRSFARFSGRSTNTARSVSRCSTAFRSSFATGRVSGAACRKAISTTCAC